MYEFSVFANFHIDTKERFIRLQDSFYSFNKSNILNWVINIRGPYYKEVKVFLEQNIKNDLIIFNLNSKNGWIEDSIKMFDNIKANIVFFWIEDHICINKPEEINLVVEEMILNGVDHLNYSFFHNGLFKNQFKDIKLSEKKKLSFFDFDINNKNNILNLCKKENIILYYPIVCVSFSEKKFFFKNLLHSKNKKKYNIMLPFNFEKGISEIDEIMPFKFGYLNKELFVSIDDDHGLKGYSLISRKLYPDRVSKQKLDDLRKKNLNIFKNNVLKKISLKILNLFKK